MSAMFQAPEISTWKMHKRLFLEATVAHNKFIRLVTKTLKDRMELIKSDDSTDIFNFLAKAKDPETQDIFGLTELGAESTTLIVAGEQRMRKNLIRCMVSD